MAVLKAIQLSKQYREHTALSNLNLSVEKGDIYCLLGQNGAGKTTTINIFLGFTEASTGQALINGIEVKPSEMYTRKMIAYIPEVVHLYTNLSAFENLAYFSKLSGFQYSDQELSDLLSRVGLQESAFMKQLVFFSKGMRQKVGIAIALGKKADIIFMDEPTSGLDPKATAEFTATCKELSNAGTTIFMATHDIFNAVNVGTKIGIMKQGSLVHTLDASTVTASSLQQLYLETI